MKEVSDFRLFKKICRKYWKRNARKETFILKKKGIKVTCYWTDKTFISYKITDFSMFNREDVRKFLCMDIHDEDIENLGKTLQEYVNEKTKLKFEVPNNKEHSFTGVLSGLLLTNNMVMYCCEELIDSDGKTYNNVAIGFQYKLTKI